MAYDVNYVPSAVLDRLRSSTLLGLFMRVATDPSLHIWFGVHDLPARFDSIDPDGTIYLGAGRLVGLPSLEILLNGTSDAVDFTMSGVDPASGSRLIDSIPEVRGALVHVGITTLDDYYQPMTEIIPLWQGVAARTAESMPVVSGREQPTLSLSLSVVAGENMRSRPSRALWSSAQQHAVSPTDDFCNNTIRYSRGVQPAWPNF
ncbi:hypothetical protein [Rhizobium lentis]|uniref:DUF2163 domain-containing protein n=1 Tax=Rhizobium lentis TaxID=1138194 RepID=A0A7W8XEG1_9HYPH|nr:hypothetical protein [Rhizobium lentis]MBB4574384.1 hypothetical protein [Rhizobium lentis]MBB5550310.1 hypothetical protein [Rhizobium lentis]MBB5560661.1 hypothetical protein [Rhizobium lentis]MBB5567246.1 hypothetical protein [Rhizobium lentis]